MNLFELTNDITLDELRKRFIDNGYNALKIRNKSVYINKTIGITVYEIYISQSYFRVINTRTQDTITKDIEMYKNVYEEVNKILKGEIV